MLKISLLLIWKRKNVITLSIFQNKFFAIGKFLKVLVDRICKILLPVVVAIGT